MPFQIVHNNIVYMRTDAIVNAANSMLRRGGGVCGAIFEAAGEEELQSACDVLAPCPVGGAVATEGYHLPVRYIIHAVGPIWRGGLEGEDKLLESAYKSALETAKSKGCRSISFPLISAGIYGYPKKEALQIAVRVFREFMEKNEMDIYLVVFDRKAVSISERLYQNVKHYIDSYAPELDRRRRMMAENFSQMMEMPPVPSGEKAQEAQIPVPMAAPQAIGTASSSPFKQEMQQITEKKKRSLKDLFGHMEETFSQMLLRFIDQKGYTEVEVYKRANMDRKLFSKIKCSKDYTPKKQTVLSLAIALRLSLDETLDLLKRAGYSLSMSSKFDVIIRYFLENEEYDIFLINETLFTFEQPLL